MEEKTETKKVKEKEVKQDTYQLSEVATQTAVVVKNTLTGDILTESQALALILNKLDKLERGLL